MPTYADRYRKQPALIAFGDAVRRVRASGGISQEELAHRAEIDRAHIGNIERGLSNITLMNLLKVAAALDVTAADLLAQAGL